MLVRLNISQWTARKYDRKVSEEVAETHKAEKNEVGRYNKILIARKAIKNIESASGEARRIHNENTLPWDDNGARILPSKNYDKYMKEMRRFRGEFEARVREFCDAYPALVDEAKIRLNGMFNIADYPMVGDIARRYGYDVAFSPIPSAQDFRVDLSSAESESIKKDIEERLAATQNIAMKDLWRRLHEVVARAAERLKEKDTVFRDSLIGNIIEVVNLLPALNLTDDPELETLRRKVEATLCQYAPKILREDEKQREEAAKSAEDILKSMAGYMGGA